MLVTESSESVYAHSSLHRNRDPLLQPIVTVILFFSPWWCYSQKADLAKGTTRTQTFAQSPDQVYSAALQLVQGNPNYELVEKEDQTRTIRFRLARRGTPGIGHYGQYLSSGIFTVQGQPINGKTRTVLTISILNDPAGTIPGTRRLTSFEVSEARLFYKLLKKELRP